MRSLFITLRYSMHHHENLKDVQDHCNITTMFWYNSRHSILSHSGLALVMCLVSLSIWPLVFIQERVFCTQYFSSCSLGTEIHRSLWLAIFVFFLVHFSVSPVSSLFSDFFNKLDLNIVLLKGYIFRFVRYANHLRLIM